MCVYLTAKMCSGCFSSRVCVYKLTQTMLILLTVSATHAGYSWTSAVEQQRRGDTWIVQNPVATATTITSVALPTFDITPSSRGLTVLVGQTALLPCVVRNLGDKVVSWIRPRDLHILTSGIYVFTTDSRMEVVHADNSDFWGLRIRNAQLADTGKYECQVNTDPKMNYAMMLTVAHSHMHESPTLRTSSTDTAGGSGSGSGSNSNAVVAIQGPSEQYVRVGSTITFTCVVSRTTPPTPAVTHPLVSRAQLKWTHAARDVTFQSSRGGISVDTDYRDDRITSALTVALVTTEDAGEYTCHDLDAYADVKSDTVTLVVVEGEHTEAMQRDPPNGAFPTQNSLLPFFFVYFNWILR